MESSGECCFFGSFWGREEICFLFFLDRFCDENHEKGAEWSAISSAYSAAEIFFSVLGTGVVSAGFNLHRVTKTFFFFFLAEVDSLSMAIVGAREGKSQVD